MTEVLKNKVVVAVLCNKCECIIGKEKVLFYTDDEIEKEKINSSTDFFVSKDIKNQANYRLILTDICSIC